MTRLAARTVLASLLVLALAVLFLAPGVQATIVPMRAGTVVSTTRSGIFTYIKAVDAEGKTFWVLTSLCTVGEGGKIEVLSGTRHDKVKSEHLGMVLEDLYAAQLLKIGDLEVEGLGAHALPEGCVTLR
ncbi:MAG TPA: hypothetical protein VI078_04425 [bacterium]